MRVNLEGKYLKYEVTDEWALQIDDKLIFS